MKSSWITWTGPKSMTSVHMRQNRRPRHTEEKLTWSWRQRWGPWSHQNWKRQGTRSPLEPPEVNMALQHLKVGLLAPELTE